MAINKYFLNSLFLILLSITNIDVFSNEEKLKNIAESTIMKFGNRYSRKIEDDSRKLLSKKEYKELIRFFTKLSLDPKTLETSVVIFDMNYRKNFLAFPIDYMLTQDNQIILPIISDLLDATLKEKIINSDRLAKIIARMLFFQTILNDFHHEATLYIINIVSMKAKQHKSPQSFKHFISKILMEIPALFNTLNEEMKASFNLKVTFLHTLLNEFEKFSLDPNAAHSEYIEEVQKSLIEFYSQCLSQKPEEAKKAIGIFTNSPIPNKSAEFRNKARKTFYFSTILKSKSRIYNSDISYHSSNSNDDDDDKKDKAKESERKRERETPISISETAQQILSQEESDQRKKKKEPDSIFEIFSLENFQQVRNEKREEVDRSHRRLEEETTYCFDRFKNSAMALQKNIENRNLHCDFLQNLKDIIEKINHKNMSVIENPLKSHEDMAEENLKNIFQVLNTITYALIKAVSNNSKEDETKFINLFDSFADTIQQAQEKLLLVSEQQLAFFNEQVKNLLSIINKSIFIKTRVLEIIPNSELQWIDNITNYMQNKIPFTTIASNQSIELFLSKPSDIFLPNLQIQEEIFPVNYKQDNFQMELYLFKTLP